MKNWTIQHKIAAGMFGTVYKVTHNTTGQEAALKLIHSTFYADRRRIKAGFVAASQVDHPNCVGMIEWVESDEGIGFVMELIDGQSIAAFQRQPLTRIVDLLIQVCNGLDALHTRDIVHRDLKPENILVTSTGQVKITDFDFVKLEHGHQHSMTGQGTFIGTVRYASPEQINDARQVDPRSDIYALGVILYELLTGRVPFDGQNWSEIALKHLSASFTPPQDIVPGLPDVIIEIIHKLLAKDPADRFQSACQVAEAFQTAQETAPSIHIEATANYLLPARFVGHTDALKSLEKAHHDLQKNNGHTIALTGPVGIGKSRLWQRFRSLHVTDTTVFEIECQPQAGSYQPLRELLRQIVENVKDQSDAEKVTLFGPFAWDLAGIAPELATQPFMTSIEKSPPLVSAQAAELRLFEAVSGLLGRLADESLIVVFEDAHQSSDQMWKLWSYLSKHLSDAPILLLLIYQNDSVEHTLDEAESIDLTPLSKDDIAIMVASMLGVDELPHPDLAKRLRDKTGGNPLFVQEVLKHLLESGDLKRDQQQWQVGSMIFSQTFFPKSVPKIIEHRLKHLSREDERVLQTAAVIGPVFDFDLLRQLIALDETDLIASLRAAQLARFIEPIQDGEQYRFHLNLTRELLTQKVSLRLRRQWHQQIATYLDERKSDDTMVSLEDVAYHYYMARDVEKAVELCRQVAEQAKAIFANEQALTFLDRALELIVTEAEREADEVDLRLQKVSILRLTGRWTNAETELAAAITLADEIDDTERLARLHGELGLIHYNRGEFDEAVSIFERQIKLASNLAKVKPDASDKTDKVLRTAQRQPLQGSTTSQPSANLAKVKPDASGETDTILQTGQREPSQGYSPLLAEAVGNLGLACWKKGDHNAALTHYDRQIDLCRTLQDRAGEARAIGNIGLVQWSLGRYDQARLAYEKQGAIYDELDDQLGQARVAGNMGLVHYIQSDYERAMEAFTQQLTISRAVGDRIGIASAVGNMGMIHRVKGELDAARTCYEEQLQINRLLDDKSGIATVLMNIGIVYAQTGQLDAALANFSDAHGFFSQTGNTQAAAMTLGNLGNVYLEKGDTEQAMRHYERGLKIYQESGDAHGISRIIGNMGEIHERRGDFDAALQSYEEKLRLSREFGDKAAIVFTLYSLGNVHRRQDAVNSALQFYEEAIELADEIDLKSMLTQCRVAKADVLYDRGEFAAAREMLDAGLSTEETDVPLDGSLLEAKLDYRLGNRDFARQQLNALSAKADTDADRALIAYEIWKLTGDTDSRSTAIDLYRQLSEQSDHIDYQGHLKELQSASPSPAPAEPQAAGLPLTDLVQSLVQMMNPETAFSEMLRLLKDQTQADGCLIITKKAPDVDDADELELRAVSPELKGLDVDFSRSILLEAMQRNESTCIANAVESRQFQHNQSVIGKQFLSVIAVPIRSQADRTEQVIGALYLDRRHIGSSPFTEADVRQVQVVADILTPVLLQQERARHIRQQSELHNLGVFIGSSGEMQTVYRDIEKFAQVDATVYIFGETGTGKELTARSLHALSPRQERRFVALNCAAIPSELVESELFGHEKGAFTGATSRQKGKFEQADGGTLFLDEIGELSLEVQAKLLRVLETREITRVGGSTTLPVDVRIVTATHRDLEQAVVNGAFRQDLFFRLNVLTITLPPLRERTSDIPRLAYAFLEEFCQTYRRQIPGFSLEALAALQAHDWRGNVRELRNRLEKAVVKHEGAQPLTTEELFGDKPPTVAVSKIRDSASRATVPIGGSLNAALEALERDLVSRTLTATDWNIAEAARQLEIDRPRLYRIMKKYGLRE